MCNVVEFRTPHCLGLEDMFEDEMGWIGHEKGLFDDHEKSKLWWYDYDYDENKVFEIE